MSIIIKDLSHIYSPDSPFEYAALKNVSLETVMCQGKMDWMVVEPNEMAIKSIVDHIDLYKM